MPIRFVNAIAEGLKPDVKPQDELYNRIVVLRNRLHDLDNKLFCGSNPHREHLRQKYLNEIAALHRKIVEIGDS